MIAGGTRRVNVSTCSDLRKDPIIQQNNEASAAVDSSIRKCRLSSWREARDAGIEISKCAWAKTRPEQDGADRPTKRKRGRPNKTDDPVKWITVKAPQNGELEIFFARVFTTTRFAMYLQSPGLASEMSFCVFLEVRERWCPHVRKSKKKTSDGLLRPLPLVEYTNSARFLETSKRKSGLQWLKNVQTCSTILIRIEL